MNRDRQQVIDAYAGQLHDDMELDERKAMRAGIRRLITLEEEALRRMEPHATQASTAANYNKARIARDGLEDALDFLVKRDIAEAKASLEKLKGLSLPRRHVAFTPAAPEPEEWYTAPVAKKRAGK